jgi:uncharacterized repeat protein (TIGR01451 family)
MNINLANLRKHLLIPSRMRRLLAAGLAVGLSLLAVSAALAVLTNGYFETGDFSGWTVTYFLNHGLQGSQPFNGASIVRDTGGYSQSAVVGPGCDPNTNNVVCYPLHGNYSARVNGPDINYVSNSIVQTYTVDAGDVSPLDGQIHIMFAFAPVLQDPGHPPAEQPWFYVGVKNVTKDIMLFDQFNFSGEAGVPWQTGVNGYLFTDWQLKDIVPGSANIALGDTIVIEVIGADCAQSGHAGYVYVDDFGPALQGLYINKTAAAQVSAGSDLTYTFQYWNNSGASVDNGVVTETIPASTTFVAADPNCTNNSGVVSCALPTPLANTISGTFVITVHVGQVPNGTLISNGNYAIAADGVPPLLGQLVTTTVVAEPADLSIAKSSRFDFFVITYTLVVKNLGPGPGDGAVVSDTLSTRHTGISWTCTTGGGAVCGGNGTGDLYDTLTTFPAGGVATYTIAATMKDFGYFENVAEVIPSTDTVDPDLTNNSSPVHRYQVLFPLIYRNDQ